VVVVVVDVVAGAVAVSVWVTVVDEVGPVTVSARVGVVADSVLVTVVVGLDEVVVLNKGVHRRLFGRCGRWKASPSSRATLLRQPHRHPLFFSHG
jgi:hypothetical protein